MYHLEKFSILKELYNYQLSHSSKIILKEIIRTEQEHKQLTHSFNYARYLLLLHVNNWLQEWPMQFSSTVGSDFWIQWTFPNLNQNKIKKDWVQSYLFWIVHPSENIHRQARIFLLLKIILTIFSKIKLSPWTKKGNIWFFFFFEKKNSCFVF